MKNRKQPLTWHVIAQGIKSKPIHPILKQWCMILYCDFIITANGKQNIWDSKSLLGCTERKKDHAERESAKVQAGSEVMLKELLHTASDVSKKVVNLSSFRRNGVLPSLELKGTYLAKKEFWEHRKSCHRVQWHMSATINQTTFGGPLGSCKGQGWIPRALLTLQVLWSVSARLQLIGGLSIFRRAIFCFRHLL